MQNASTESVLKKVKESLEQTARDVEVFFKLFPDFTEEDLDKINFITLSLLPATTQLKEICNECQKNIVFRDDLNPNCSQYDSLAELLCNDMTQSNKQDSKEILKEKLQINNSMKTPTDRNLNLMKNISSRLVGMGSLYISKMYGPSRSYQGAVHENLQEVNESVSKDLENALYLSPDQVRALNSCNFVVTGFYGVGKTTVLEVAIDKIMERYPCPKIVVLTWDTSLELKNMYNERFDKWRDSNQTDACLDVLSLEEACTQYQVKPLQHPLVAWISSMFWLDRTKIDVINDLCKKIQGE